MMSLELSQADQTTVLFFLFSAVGLVRERQVLPFLMVVIGTLLHGPLVAALVAGLVIWHRMDRQAVDWVRLKDYVGLFFIMGGAISPEPFQGFFAFTGVVLLSFSFGKGFLGILPALLLFRQYFPQPERPEIALIAAGAYWVAAESFRWFKSAHEGSVLIGLELVCSAVILLGFSGEFDRWFAHSVVIALGSTILFVVVALFAWTRWRLEGFRKTLLAFRENALRALTFGSRVVDAKKEWGGVSVEPTPARGPGEVMDRMFFVVAATLVYFGLFLLAVKGGL
jgi:predicted membrane channel-forming protein YqfA (hemolysin III family)